MNALMEKREITTILINVICIKMLLTFPRIFVLDAGSAAWIQVIYATLITFVLYFLTIKIYEKSGKRSVIMLSEKIGGKWLKTIVGIVLFLVLIGNMTMSLRAFPESVKAVLLGTTNMSFIVIALAVVLGIGAYIGIEGLGRLNTIFLPVAGGVLLIYLVLALPYCNINHLFPILGKGAYSIFAKGLEGVTLFGDIILLNLLMPYCKNYESAKKSGYWAILISGLISLIIILVYVLIFRYPASTQFTMPAYQISRIVRIGPFFQRFEAFFEFVWSISLYMYGSVYIFMIAKLLKDTFELRYEKPIIFAVTVICIAIMFLPESMIDILQNVRWMAYVTYALGFFLPILLGILYRIKRKQGEQNEKK